MIDSINLQAALNSIQCIIWAGDFGFDNRQWLVTLLLYVVLSTFTLVVNQFSLAYQKLMGTNGYVSFNYLYYLERFFF